MISSFVHKICAHGTNLECALSRAASQEKCAGMELSTNDFIIRTQDLCLRHKLGVRIVSRSEPRKKRRKGEKYELR